MRLFRRPPADHEAAFKGHIKRWFGQTGPFAGWPAQAGLPQVLEFTGHPTDGLTTLMTFGLSHYVLGDSSGQLREELLCVGRSPQVDGALAHRLAVEAALAATKGRAILPDDVGSIGDPIASRPQFREFWACLPHGFGDGFGSVLAVGLPFHLVQVVPLTAGEVDHAQMIGGHQFGHDVEDLWADLVNLDRTSLFAPIRPVDGFRWAGLVDFDASPDEDRVSPDAISRLQGGDLAKLGFDIEPKLHPGPQSERMWVEVTRVDAGGYTGRLANTPAYLLDLAEGRELTFEARHVLDVLPNPHR